MALIDELYKPEILLLCTGGHFTMGPIEAAHSVSRFFKSAKTVIPMHFNTFPPLLPDTFPEFQKNLEQIMGWKGQLVDSFNEILGKELEFC
jgi:L-ascorbate metabolism protein UlaG (beta-lactamase superfamily)